MRCQAAERSAPQPRADAGSPAGQAGPALAAADAHHMAANPLFGQEGSPCKAPGAEAPAAAAAEVAALREQLAAAVKERDTARQQFARWRAHAPLLS